MKRYLALFLSLVMILCALPLAIAEEVENPYEDDGIVIYRDADGNVIDGLYCVGNVGGVFYGGADYPFHQTGLSLGRCYTFGMLAAKHAMGQL